MTELLPCPHSSATCEPYRLQGMRCQECPELDDEKYNPTMVALLKRLEIGDLDPEAVFDNAEDLMAYLNATNNAADDPTGRSSLIEDGARQKASDEARVTKPPEAADDLVVKELQRLIKHGYLYRDYKAIVRAIDRITAMTAEVERLERDQRFLIKNARQVSDIEEIEALRSTITKQAGEIERLRDALKVIATPSESSGYHLVQFLTGYASAALHDSEVSDDQG